ncbi:helix-turn-helix domain-containing protein [Halarchaeum sp. P4]|uniref:helix-turn-helix domain-containing protein n=1 Tax=Halarchaeum sp. P4 TaxID=3421639 RepID=UPI003EB6D0DA
MKRLSVTFDRTGDDAARFAPAEGRRGALQTVRLCRDGTVLELCQFADPAAGAVADTLADDSAVLDYAVVDEHTLYVHLRPGARVLALLDLLESHRLILDTPVRFDADRVTVTLVGRAERITEAADALPDDVRADMRVERLAEYTGDHPLQDALTQRQREVLATAIDVGYYQNPRDATVADVAAELGVAVSTASEHLRKIEARVLPRLVDGT